MLNSASSQSPTNLKIRAVEADEFELLLAVIEAAYIEYDGKLTPPSGAQDETVTSLATKLECGAGAIAWQDSTAVGSVLYEVRTESMYLGRLAVPPLCRKRGIGALLVHYVEEQA